MATYKLASFGVKHSSGANIPADPGNRDWREYQQWLAAGNTPDPADPPPAPEPSAAKAERQLTSDSTLAALVAVLADKFGIASADLLALVKTKAADADSKKGKS